MPTVARVCETWLGGEKSARFLGTKFDSVNYFRDASKIPPNNLNAVSTKPENPIG